MPELDKKQIFLVTFDIAYIALYDLRTGEAYKIYAASSHWTLITSTGYDNFISIVSVEKHEFLSPVLQIHKFTG